MRGELHFSLWYSVLLYFYVSILDLLCRPFKLFWLTSLSPYIIWRRHVSLTHFLLFVGDFRFQPLYGCAVLCWMVINWRIFNTMQRGKNTSVWNLAITYHRKGPLSRFFKTEGALSIWIVACSDQWIVIKEQIFDQSSGQRITDRGVTSRRVEWFGGIHKCSGWWTTTSSTKIQTKPRELNKIWKINTKVNGFIIEKVGDYSVAILFWNSFNYWNWFSFYPFWLEIVWSYIELISSIVSPI